MSAQAWRLVGNDRGGISFSRSRSPIGVRLSTNAWENVLEVLERTSDVDGCEAGGLLIGTPLRDDLVKVLNAWGPTRTRAGR